MIQVCFDIHEFLYAIEGFARGSHLRQHVWEEFVYRSIPQMSDDEMDFLWFYMRRDLWECYFYEIGGKPCTHVGHEDFLHAMAALHRGNRYKVKFISETDNKQHEAICYRFDGHYRPLFMGRSKNVESYNAYIPNDWVKTVKKQPMPENRHVEYGKEAWWTDLSVYEEVNRMV